MGEYTGIRFHATLNETGAKVASLLANPHIDFTWEMVAEVLGQTSPIDLRAWLQRDRINFIPHGAVKHIIPGWKRTNSMTGAKRCRKWTVCCAVKDPHVVDYFLTNILPQLLAAPVTVEIYSTEAGGSKMLSITPLNYKPEGQPILPYD